MAVDQIHATDEPRYAESQRCHWREVPFDERMGAFDVEENELH